MTLKIWLSFHEMNEFNFEVPHPSEVALLQKSLREKIVLSPKFDSVSLVAGADVSFSKEYPDRFFAAFVVLTFPDMEVLEKSFAVVESKFPYIPGFLSFREIPALIEAYKKLKNTPDVIIVDGHGIAHPRGMGIAAHLGLVLERPTIGCAKKKLVGAFEMPDEEVGSISPITYKGEKIGYALRSKKKVKPIFISPGHFMDFESSLEIIEKCFRGYKLPEPTRQAHLYANEVRRGYAVP